MIKKNLNYYIARFDLIAIAISSVAPLRPLLFITVIREKRPRVVL